jgi:pyridoxal phosphate enzyme (YggS family)
MFILTPEEEKTLQIRFASVLARMQKAIDRAADAHACTAYGGQVALVAISKRHQAESLAVIARAWQELMPELPVIFAENYMQEALSKQDALTKILQKHPAVHVCWHFSGHLQSNKAKLLPGRFELLHTLDSLSLAQNLHKLASNGDSDTQNMPQGLPQSMPQTQKVLVQVNIGEEQQKSGVMPDAAAEFIKKLFAFPAVSVQGLMCLPPITDRAEDSRPFFCRLRQLRDELEQKLGVPLPHLSMGMSHDFEVAIEEGASLIRVGTAIFGERKK